MQPRVPIQAITFDVGGTLIAPWPSVGHVYADVAARAGVPSIEPGLLNERFKSAWRAHRNFNHSYESWAQIVDETFRGLCSPPPSRTFFRELFDRFAQPEAWRVFDDVFPTLNALANRGVPLAIVSNWDDRLRPLLRRLELDRFFIHIIVSCEAGFAKPNPEIFQAAANRLGCPPQSILHVGDELEHDRNAARSVGFQALRICRGTDALKTDEDIRSLGELLPAIDGDH